MSRRPKQSRKPPKKAKAPKVDHRVHHAKTRKGRTYKFTDKHHNFEHGDHACWLKSITRDLEFSLFQDAEDSDFCDEDANLYNVHRNGEDYIVIGTQDELLAIFWNPDSAAEWHGHPIWPIKARGQLNRKNQGYKPPALPLQRMVEKKRISQRDADRLLRGDYP